MRDVHIVCPLIRKSTCQCRGYGFDPWSKKSPYTALQLSLWAQLLSPQAATTEVHALQSPCSTTREATTARSLSSAKTTSPTRYNWRKPLSSNKDPPQPKNKIINLKKESCAEILQGIWGIWAPAPFSLLGPARHFSASNFHILVWAHCEEEIWRFGFVSACVCLPSFSKAKIVVL